VDIPREVFAAPSVLMGLVRCSLTCV